MLGTLATPIVRRLRVREPAWRRAPMWVPAPRGAVDPATVGLDAGALEMPKAFAQLEAPPVFICGSARSGTTWTFDLFDRHPQVAAICESWILSQTRRDQHPHPAVLGRGRQAGVAGARRGAFGAVQLLSYEEVLRDLRLVGRSLMKGFSPGHRYLAAKEPLDVGAAAILFPEARFIHVLRDGRNVALSMKRASESWDPTMGVGLPMEMRAEEWRRQVENIRSQRAGLGGRYMEIRYEEMRADVTGALRTMFDFAGIPYDNRLLEEIAARTQLTAYGEPALQSGFRGGGEKAGWVRGFSLREALGFHRAAGELLMGLGYESDVRWWARRWAQRRR